MSLQIPNDQAGNKKSRDKSILHPAYLGAIAAIISAVVPLTAFINGHYERELLRDQHLFQVRLEYLDRAIKSSEDPFYKESVLNFLISTLEIDDPMYTWASEELERARSVLKLKRLLTEKNKELGDLQKALAEMRTIELEESSMETAQEIQHIQKELTAAADKARTLVAVPSLLGMSYDLAEKVLLESGLGIQTLIVHSGDTRDPDAVITSQQPSSGTRVPSGTNMQLELGFRRPHTTLDID